MPSFVPKFTTICDHDFIAVTQKGSWISVPAYQSFWHLAFVNKYSRFCRQIDDMNYKVYIDQYTMEVVWQCKLRQLYAEWTSTKSKEERKKCLDKALWVPKLTADTMEAYWVKKQEKFGFKEVMPHGSTELFDIKQTGLIELMLEGTTESPETIPQHATDFRVGESDLDSDLPTSEPETKSTQLHSSSEDGNSAMPTSDDSDTDDGDMFMSELETSSIKIDSGSEDGDKAMSISDDSDVDDGDKYMPGFETTSTKIDSGSEDGDKAMSISDDSDADDDSELESGVESISTIIDSDSEDEYRTMSISDDSDVDDGDKSISESNASSTETSDLSPKELAMYNHMLDLFKESRELNNLKEELKESTKREWEKAKEDLFPSTREAIKRLVKLKRDIIEREQRRRCNLQ